MSGLVETAASKEDVANTLLALKGIGPKTVEIFLREVPDSVIGSRG